MRTSSPRRPIPERSAAPAGAFTLIELLVTLVILLLVLVTLLQFTTSAEQAWAKGSADPFAEAEDAFETIVNHVQVATLDSYQDYADQSGTFRATGAASFIPDHLARRSDLAFACGPATGATGWLQASGRITAGHSLFFVAPQGYTRTESHLGLERLLNALGYFVEFGDQNTAPVFMVAPAHRWRWRLKEVAQPSEFLAVYASATSSTWVDSLVQTGAPVSVLADNVAALIVLPERAAADSGTALTTDYRYDSRDASNPLTRHQLPARLRLALVAIDEDSAQNLAHRNGSQPPAVLSPDLFLDPSKMTADLATLDASLNAAKINHRILQREIILTSAAWSEALSQ